MRVRFLVGIWLIQWGITAGKSKSPFVFCSNPQDTKTNPKDALMGFFFRNRVAKEMRKMDCMNPREM